MDQTERALLAETLRKTMAKATGAGLDAALLRLGWPDLLADAPDIAIPLVFGLLGETGTHASILNDVVGRAAPLPYAGGSWVVWSPAGSYSILDPSSLDPELPLRTVSSGEVIPLAAGRRALGWWLVGTGRAMLALARDHAIDRVQFGRPLASFQAVRHRLAETLVALEGAEATLVVAADEFGSLLAKAAAGHAALTAARHCQQVLGGMGFTAEHDFHRHVRRTLVLDGLLGSARELTREAGALLRTQTPAPRLVQL